MANSAIRLTSHGLVLALANFVENIDGDLCRGTEFIVEGKDFNPLGTCRVLDDFCLSKNLRLGAVGGSDLCDDSKWVAGSLA